MNTITSRYSLQEDRILLDCLIHNGDDLQPAFTQRLPRAFVTELVRRVVTIVDNPLMHDFAQDDAIIKKPQSEAVRVSGGYASWLVTHVHFQEIEGGARVIFTEDDERAVHLDCAEAILRNLIDIFHKSFTAAEWDLGVFPAWASGDAGVSPQPQIIN